MYENKSIFLWHMQFDFERTPYPGSTFSIFPHVEPMCPRQIGEEFREQGKEKNWVKS